jgi:MFS transporter, MHS family, alpha-ketoglutarate permease
MTQIDYSDSVSRSFPDLTTQNISQTSSLSNNSRRGQKKLLGSKGKFGRVKEIVIASTSNAVEWYDFYAYATFSLIFAPVLFPKEDVLTQQIYAAALFSISFIVRPVGGLIFGWLADSYGRSKALIWSVWLMFIGSFAIAIAPTYKMMGLMATLWLFFARILQGLSVGGQYGITATYVAEVATDKHVGFLSSFQSLTEMGGQLFCLGILFIVQYSLTQEQLSSYGWRIPFLIGAVLALATIISMYWGISESTLFQEEGQKGIKLKESLRELFSNYWQRLLMIFGLTAGGGAAFYTYTTYMQKFLKFKVHLVNQEITQISIAALLFGMLLQPCYGYISDLLGRKYFLLLFGCLGAFSTIPLLKALEHATTARECFWLLAAGWAILSLYRSVSNIIKAELFPPYVRAIGVSLGHSVAIAISGGTIDMIGLWCEKIRHQDWFYYYLTLLIIVTFISALYLPNRQTRYIEN